jgi:hypothetical protein
MANVRARQVAVRRQHPTDGVWRERCHAEPPVTEIERSSPDGFTIPFTVAMSEANVS